MEELRESLSQYNEQLTMVNAALLEAAAAEKESLLALQSDLHQLIQLTQESLDALNCKRPPSTNAQHDSHSEEKPELDDEYALFMQEMAASGAYEGDNSEDKNSKDAPDSKPDSSDESDIEDELASLLGMKCAVYHTHKWGGQSLHNAMVSSVVPRQGDDQFNDLQVRVLFTHPTHAEMLPCPFFLDGECRFDDDKCRYSHGLVVQLSNLKEAIEPDFNSIKVGSRVLLKIKPPNDEDLSLTKKSSEKYHLWHRAVVTSVEDEKRTCSVKLESGAEPGEKRKHNDEYQVQFEEIFPLNVDDDDTDSDNSLSDTEYGECSSAQPDDGARPLADGGRPMGEWERHTRGMGSKLMLAMGYVPGSGLGRDAAGRVQPVEARVVPPGRSLDHCMALAEQAKDPLKVEQRLKRLQKKEEERNKRAYEREKERERRNVFNFINKTLGDKADGEPATAPGVDIKQSTSKDLNIEQFKITEDTKRVEREILKLNTSLSRHSAGTEGYKRIQSQIMEKNKELNTLNSREQKIAKEQNHRKDKRKMTVF